MVEKSKYGELGVEARKKSLETIKPYLDNMFQNAFCPIVLDPELDGYGIILHTDGAGSKPVQAYLHYKETRDIKWFNGTAVDVMAMNLDDVMCISPTAEALAFVNYIAINPLRIPKPELLNSLVPEFQKCLKKLGRYGIEIKFLGGETADLPDQLRTIDVSGVISGRAVFSEAISGDQIRPGNVIIGIRSGGRAKYEKKQNSGLMCNGITLARHCLMQWPYEEKYPEIKELIGKGYYGGFEFGDYIDELEMTVGEAILSPTRIFAPIIRKVFEEHKDYVTGFVHNTGGGQTKCLKIGRNIHYIKNNLFDPDPIFVLIQRESKTSWEEMHEDFNMGDGFEITAEETDADDIIETIESFGVEARVIGKCEKSNGRNKVTIDSKFGTFEYN